MEMSIDKYFDYLDQIKKENNIRQLQYDASIIILSMYKIKK